MSASTAGPDSSTLAQMCRPGGFRRLAVAAVTITTACAGPTPPPLSTGRACEGATLVAADATHALADCAEIAGDLTIEGAAITELGALSSLRRVRGSLGIGPTIRLETLAGLAALERVDGNLAIAGNHALTGIYLGNLIAVSGDVTIDRNPQAETASLHRLRSVGGSIEITANGSLLRLDLGALSRVGGAIEVSDNGALDDVDTGAVSPPP